MKKNKKIRKKNNLCCKRLKVLEDLVEEYRVSCIDELDQQDDEMDRLKSKIKKYFTNLK